MPKKHREKRQKYVEHLLRLEKDREEYLKKRMAPKRSRDTRHEEDIFDKQRDEMVAGPLKHPRLESSSTDKNKILGTATVAVSADAKEKKDLPTSAKSEGKRVKRRY